MGDEEYLKFEITDQDLESEFTQHRYRRLTKNQQIYGIWADDEDDSDDDNRGRKHSKKVKKDYTAPVNFVAGGIHQPGKKQEDEDDEKVVDENAPIISDSSDEELSKRPSFSQKSKQPQASNEPEMTGFRSRSFRAANPILSDQNIGHWEKYTKGIGSKIMFGMGFQPGKGLGKELQGIDAPIEAHLRKGRGAIGAYGPEKKQNKMKGISNEKAIADEGSSKPQKSNRTSQWRKENSEPKKQIRYVYKTIDDVMEESKKPGKKKIEISELSKVKVIDMTGPEQRVLSGYHAISGVQKPAEEWEMRKDKKFTNFDMPELLHNLNLLVDVCQEAIIDNARKLGHAEDRLKILEDQVINLEKTKNQEKVIVDNIKEIIEILETVLPSTGEKIVTLNEAENVFSKLKENHYNEFCYFQIPVLAVNVIRPLFNKFLQDWKPLEDPEKPIPSFLKWRSVLIIDSKNDQAPDSYQLNPYFKLVWDTWIPCVRNAVNNWECRDWSPMVDLIMKWIPLTSKWILDNILENMILKRIQYHVEEWNPMTDPVPIHSWIYPWVSLLAKQFETTVYPTIRQKLSKALTKWHPSDSSARLMLQPWCSVFEPGEMQAFIVNNIVPKLQTTLQDLVINPNHQCLDNWKWTMEWSEMIPPHAMAALLDRSFFPKWLQTLGVWLNMDPDFEQIGKWYSGWKAIIPDSVKTQPIVADHLRAALQMMSRAVGGTSAPEPLRETRNVEPVVEISFSTEGPPTSMKALVQKYCHDAGILFMPVPNRFFEAKQVYRCGKLNIYFDKNVIFCSQAGGIFTPVSWQEALENAK